MPKQTGIYFEERLRTFMNLNARKNLYLYFAYYLRILKQKRSKNDYS